MSEIPREKILDVIAGRDQITLSELGYVATRLAPIKVDAEAAVGLARELGGDYFLQMADQLERFIQSEEIVPLPVESMQAVYNNIEHTIRDKMQNLRTEGGKVIADMSDGDVLRHQAYFGLVAQYIAFEPAEKIH